MESWSLTGNIGCGKGVVERRLANRGVPVIDADQVAREVVAPGEPALAEVVRVFGPKVLRPDGSLDRPALGARVFADPGRRKALEAILHPAIAARTQERLSVLRSRGHPLAVVSAALSVETGSWRLYDGLLVVTCPEENQRARLMVRDGLDAAAAQARISAQLPQAEKASLASTVFVNDGSVEELGIRVDAWLDGWRKDRSLPPANTSTPD